MVSIELQRSERRKEDGEGRRHAWQQGKGHGEVTSPSVYKPPPSPSTCSSTTTADGRGGIRSGLHTSRLGHNDYCVYIRFWENFQRNKQDISKAESTARAARRPETARNVWDAVREEIQTSLLTLLRVLCSPPKVLYNEVTQ